jgi:hypothetical protein
LHEHLEQASPDLLRELMEGFINKLLSADDAGHSRSGSLGYRSLVGQGR